MTTTTMTTGQLAVNRRRNERSREEARVLSIEGCSLLTAAAHPGLAAAAAAATGPSAGADVS